MQCVKGTKIKYFSQRIRIHYDDDQRFPHLSEKMNKKIRNLPKISGILSFYIRGERALLFSRPAQAQPGPNLVLKSPTQSGPTDLRPAQARLGRAGPGLSSDLREKWENFFCTFLHNF